MNMTSRSSRPPWQITKERWDELKIPKSRWGAWRFQSSNLVLKHDNDYEIDLEKINSCAQMLNWIFQLNHKSDFAYGADVAKNLVEAFDDIFRPQSNCCSWGNEQSFSGSKLAKAHALKLKKYKQGDSNLLMN